MYNTFSFVKSAVPQLLDNFAFLTFILDSSYGDTATIAYLSFVKMSKNMLKLVPKQCNIWLLISYDQQEMFLPFSS